MQHLWKVFFVFVFKIGLVSRGRSHGIPKWYSLLRVERKPSFTRESQHSPRRGVQTNEVVLRGS